MLNQRLTNPRVYLIAACIYLAAFLLWNLISLRTTGHLTDPFIFDYADSFMDFFNVNLHASSRDLYTTYSSFYSPPNIFLAKLLTPHECVGMLDKYEFRKCGIGYFYGFEVFFFLLNGGLLWRILKGAVNRVWWLILFLLSFPMMFAIERGNYIVIALSLACLLVLAKSPIKKLFLLAFLPLVKYYLIIGGVGLFLNKKYIKILYFIAIFLTFNIIFSYINDIPHANLIFSNLTKFSKGNGGIYNIWNATNISSIGEAFSTYYFYDSILVKIAHMLLIGVSMLCIWAYYVYVSENYQYGIDINKNLFLLLMLFLIISPTAGYYSIILLYPFIADYLSRKSLSIYEKILIIALLLPYPIKLFKLSEIILDPSLWIGNSQLRSSAEELFPIYFQVQSIIIPVTLLMIFFCFIRTIEFKEESNEKN